MRQINWSLSKQELLFSDFCEDSDNIEEGAEYNKVLWLIQPANRTVSFLFFICLNQNIFVFKIFVPVQLFLDYTAETYCKFMQGDDTFEHEDEAFITKLSKHIISVKDKKGSKKFWD